MVVVNPLFELTIEKYERKEGGPKAFRIRGIASATVRMSRARPADECDIAFPNHKDFTLDVFEPRDVVSLSLGHKEFDLGVSAVFKGPITEIGPNLPLTIKAQSEGAATRCNKYTTTYRNKTWKDIAKDALGRAKLTAEVSGESPPTKPPADFRVDDQTPAQVLERCCSESLWVWYVIPGTDKGRFGPRWEDVEVKEKCWLFVVGENVFSDGCELEYTKQRGLKRVVVTLHDSESQRAPVTGKHQELDYEDGDVAEKIERTVSNPTAAAANALAEEEYRRLTNPIKGSFTAVGNPLIRPGMKIAVRNPKVDDAIYYVMVDEVDHTLAEHFYSMRVTVAGAGGGK